MWMSPQWVLIAVATFVSEDLTCIATGVLIAQGGLGFAEGTLACLAGIVLGDLSLFMLGRAAGSSGALGRWVSAEKLAAATAWVQRHGLRVVIASRFTPGLRLPTYLAAGFLRSRFWVFAGYFVLAAALWTPLLVGASAWFGAEALRGVLGRDEPFAIVALVAAFYGALQLRDFEKRRRVVGFVRRKLEWEFWPAWAAYLPLLPYFLYLAVRHWSLTLFTSANPGIFAGGLMGESKSAILRHLSRVPGAVAAFQLVPEGTRVVVARFPAVLKPDVGERGSGVAIVRSQAEADGHLRAAKGPTILQEYVPGDEFGVYYVRYPDEARGRVLGVTEKRFAWVTGDGRRSLRELILRDRRAVCMADAYFRVSKRPLESVPVRGEAVTLGEIGSHCRGAVFLDGSRLITPELEGAIERVSRAHPGFHLGRYDVRAESAAALRRGEFRVIELNGVAAEPAQVYDPSMPVWRKYRTMARHWRMAFEIGAWYRERGVRPIGVRELCNSIGPQINADEHRFRTTG